MAVMAYVVLVRCPGHIAGLIGWITWIEWLRWVKKLDVSCDFSHVDELDGSGGSESTKSQ